MKALLSMLMSVPLLSMLFGGSSNVDGFRQTNYGKRYEMTENFICPLFPSFFLCSLVSIFSCSL